MDESIATKAPQPVKRLHVQRSSSAPAPRRGPKLNIAPAAGDVAGHVMCADLHSLVGRTEQGRQAGWKAGWKDGWRDGCISVGMDS